MATKVITNAQILMGGYDISSSFNQVSLSETVEVLDRTTFGNTNRIYKGGLSRIRLTGAGVLEESTGPAVGNILYNDVGLEDEVVSVYPDTVVEGVYSGYAFKSVVSRYTPLTGGVGELFRFTVEADSRGVV